MEIIISWIGATDLKCAIDRDPDNCGPVVQAVLDTFYDRIILLSNFSKGHTQLFLDWLSSACSIETEVHFIKLSSPTEHKEIYAFTRNIVREIQQKYPEAHLTFHSSPGTPAMAVSWFLLAPVFGARVIESSREYGVKVVSFPFEIAAFFCLTPIL